jgi:hypothetical protein
MPSGPEDLSGLRDLRLLYVSNSFTCKDEVFMLTCVRYYVCRQRRNEGLPEMQRANQCGSLLFKLFILNAPFD